jgi:hypothetical protein
MVQTASQCQCEFRAMGAFLCALVAGAALCAAATQERGKREADAVALARRTVSTRLSIPPERIDTLGVSPAEWRDSSLGCPEPGTAYTPALSSGYAVTLRANDREHVVHVAGGRAVICSTRPDPKQPPTPMVSSSLKAAAAVRAALAARLGIEPSRVRIVSTRPFRSTTSCPAAPASPKGTALIVDAEASAQIFRYYSDDTQALSCDK